MPARALEAASKISYEITIGVEFLGIGRECCMRANVRMYNPGINTVRLNRLLLKANGNHRQRLSPSSFVDQRSLPVPLAIANGDRRNRPPVRQRAGGQHPAHMRRNRQFLVS